MRAIQSGTSSPAVSRLAYGCWRIVAISDPASAVRDSAAANSADLNVSRQEGYRLLEAARDERLP